MVAVIKNGVSSEREGEWNLHVATVEDSMPMIGEMDSYNYLRYCLDFKDIDPTVNI